MSLNNSSVNTPSLNTPSLNTPFIIDNMSIYIPKVFGNITKERITSILEFLDIGMVNHIDFVAKISSNGKVYNSAYIHFDFWYSNISNQNLQYRLKNSIESRIVYDDPWYWIVLENKATKRDYSVPKPKIKLDLLNELDLSNDLDLIKKEVKAFNKLFLPRALTRDGKTFVKKLSNRDDREDFKEQMWEQRCIEKEEGEY